MLEQLSQRLQALQKTAGIEGDHGTLPLGIAPIDAALGGGLARGALHEIAAVSEAHLAAAAGFALGLVSPSSRVSLSSPLPLAGEVDRRRRSGGGLMIASPPPPALPRKRGRE